MEIKIPELSLVVLVGVSGSGKSTFARKHFKRTEILSSDECRAIVSDDENNQAATNDAFDLLHFIAAKRLKNGLLTVVDATNVQQESRKSLVSLARDYHCLPVALVLDVPEKVCLERNKKRSDRSFGKHVVFQQRSQLKRSLKSLKREGFRHIYVLRSEDEVEAVSEIIREKLYNDKKDVSGPFDIIGDVHGCFDELVALLQKLGYILNSVEDDGLNFGMHVTHPDGRTAVFLGDLVDRGPASPAVLKLVMSMVAQGTAYCVPGNHDMKLHRKLSGKNVNLNHGLDKTMEQLAGETEGFKKQVQDFIYGLTSHYVFDEGKLVVAHAGLTEEMQGRGSGAVRSFCMFGETTGEIDEFGLPVRYNWASEYRGKAMVVYGHTPVPEPQWLNRTIDIDTGCVFGGKLTALRYPESELVSVPARQVYCEPSRPLDYAETSTLTHQQEYDDLLDIEDVLGKRIISTKLRGNVTVREENTVAALEVMSRFAVNPKWLIYLPPTMSPSETSELPDYLEHPAEAIKHYKGLGVKKLICEEKHMGSRAVLVVCKDEKVAKERFGIENEGIGTCYTRSGRSFFHDAILEQQFLQRVNDALQSTGVYEQLETDWICLDAELMPWSAKAQALLQGQYAAVGASASVSLASAIETLALVKERTIEGINSLFETFESKQSMVGDFIRAYQQYCWPVNSINDLKLAPFHVLVTEGKVHVDKPHAWHMQMIARLCKADPLLHQTKYKIVDVEDEEDIQNAIDWWVKLTEDGGEGMVIKPLDFVFHGKKGLVQPAIKCRGREYLRIIYGPEYTAPENMQRLKSRGLSRKRALALQEFALGEEGLQRFIRKEPLRRVHECVFGVLSLESEPIDPRL